MTSPPRHAFPGSRHHVTARGLNRQPIFLVDADRADFVRRLGGLCRDSATGCFAWALMSNHHHEALEVGELSLSNFMLRLNAGHARSFNRRHQRSGKVIQGRFHSWLIDSDAYRLELVRYIHLNPVRAGLVSSLDELATYPWTGHAALMGTRTCAFMDVDRVLSWFGPTRAQARLELCRFLETGLKGCDHPGRAAAADAIELSTRDQDDLGMHGFRGMLATSERVDAIVRELDARSLERQRLVRGGWTPDRVLTAVCQRLGADETEVRSGRRGRASSTARAVAAALIVDRLGATLASTGRLLGVSAAAISLSRERGRELARDLSGESGFLTT